MKPQTRARLLWTVASLVLAYALLNIVIYFVAGTFGTGWFILSLAIYGGALVGALLLLAAEREKPQEEKQNVTNVQVTIPVTGPSRQPPIMQAPPIETPDPSNELSGREPQARLPP